MQEYYKLADNERMNIHEYLTIKAQQLNAGENGLVALDSVEWQPFNFGRSVDLTGLIVGITLQTKPEEIYRALLESAAYGTRKIVETFRDNGVPVHEFFAAGGIAQKNSLMMQIYADVINMPVKIGGSSQAPALASAIFGAVAAGSDRGGYNDVLIAGKVMGKLDDRIYYPIPENVVIYDRLYREYSDICMITSGNIQKIS